MTYTGQECSGVGDHWRSVIGADQGGTGGQLMDDYGPTVQDGSRYQVIDVHLVRCSGEIYLKEELWPHTPTGER